MHSQDAMLDLVADLILTLAEMEKMVMKLDDLIGEQAPPEDDLPF